MLVPGCPAETSMEPVLVTPVPAGLVPLCIVVVKGLVPEEVPIGGLGEGLPAVD